jgi:hypothetical protein
MSIAFISFDHLVGARAASGKGGCAADERQG